MSLITKGQDAILICDQCFAVLLPDGSCKPFHDATNAELAPWDSQDVLATAAKAGWTEKLSRWWCRSCGLKQQT
jgi:hypothetical protein